MTDSSVSVILQFTDRFCCVSRRQVRRAPTAGDRPHAPYNWLQWRDDASTNWDGNDAAANWNGDDATTDRLQHGRHGHERGWDGRPEPDVHATAAASAATADRLHGSSRRVWRVLSRLTRDFENRSDSVVGQCQISYRARLLKVVRVDCFELV